MKYLLFICIIFYIISCTQTPPKEEIVEKALVDTSMIAIMPYDSTESWGFENEKPAKLTSSDISKIEKLLNSCINEYNVPQQKLYNEVKARYTKEQIRKENFIIDLKRYKRQYEVIINAKGEKEVWVNCFCSSHDENWKKEPQITLDGGNCYFNLKINLSKYTYYDLMVNGDA